MILLIDLGNSRGKWATWSGDLYSQQGAVDRHAAEWEGQLRRHFQALATPDQNLLASVADTEVGATTRNIIGSLWGREPVQLLTRARQCGVHNAYSEPGQMGVDRWLAMLAAWNRFQCAVCVVDIGTAMTVDMVTAEGRHLGGLITPGSALSESVLHANTAGIRQADPEASLGLGQSTGACVANGSLISMLGMLRIALELMECECGAGGKLVVTGGDASRMLPFLPPSSVHIPNLVFDGMLLAGKD